MFDLIEQELKRMRFKRASLTIRDDQTPEDWDNLAEEYEELNCVANAASCRVRAKQMREMAVGDAP